MNMHMHLCILLVVAFQFARTKVLLVSMDGFRWDYINKVDTPNFDIMAKEGVRVPYMNTTFLTVTFPCHYSIVTGLYEESHGITGNRMYDPVFKEYFTMTTKDSKWWDGGQPMWNVVQKYGLRSGVYLWPESDCEIKGLRPNLWRPYDQDVPFKSRVDTVIGWLTTNSTKDAIDLAMLYFHEPDATGHTFGPSSKEIEDKISEMDQILGYILEKFEENALWDTVNLIVISDHGMVDIDPRTKSIDLSQVIDLSAIDIMSDYGPFTHIQSVSGREDELYTNLSSLEHIEVFKKENIPERWHYRNNRRILPILVVADEGWNIYKNFSALSDEDKNLKGDHGYDNQLSSMKPIFFARGPNIKKNYTVAPFNSVDIYPLVAKLLGVPPGPHNGTLDNVKDFIVELPNSFNTGTANRNWLHLLVLAVALTLPVD